MKTAAVQGFRERRLAFSPTESHLRPSRLPTHEAAVASTGAPPPCSRSSTPIWSSRRCRRTRACWSARGSTGRLTSLRASGHHRNGRARAAPGRTGPSGSLAAPGRRANGGALERARRRSWRACDPTTPSARPAPWCRAGELLAGALAPCRRACGPQRPPEPGSGLPGRTTAVCPGARWAHGRLRVLLAWAEIVRSLGASVCQAFELAGTAG